MGRDISMTVTVVTLDIDIDSYPEELRDKVAQSLSRSINRGLEKARTRAKNAILDQVNFAASYLSPSGGRLSVNQKASKQAFTGSIEGRDRPTMLARFSKSKLLTGGQRHKGGEVSVQVKPGGPKKAIKRAFIIKLKSGNLGLATRTNGGAPPGAYKPKEIGKNLWLLYGPSVDQALLQATSGGGVFQDLEPQLLDEIETEFQRQMELSDG
jgi:hypothetical protein